MPILNKDPNAPPDPSELREIPDTQAPAGVDLNRDNPVTPGVPPSADNPVGIPPDEKAEPHDTGESKRWRDDKNTGIAPTPPMPPAATQRPAPEPKHEEPKKKK